MTNSSPKIKPSPSKRSPARHAVLGQHKPLPKPRQRKSAAKSMLMMKSIYEPGGMEDSQTDSQAWGEAGFPVPSLPDVVPTVSSSQETGESYPPFESELSSTSHAPTVSNFEHPERITSQPLKDGYQHLTKAMQHFLEAADRAYQDATEHEDDHRNLERQLLHMTDLTEKLERQVADLKAKVSTLKEGTALLEKENRALEHEKSEQEQELEHFKRQFLSVKELTDSVSNRLTQGRK